MMSDAVKIKCPTCQKPADFSSENPHRPFCSARCKLIDLGAWAAEDYKIPTQENPSTPDTDDSTED